MKKDKINFIITLSFTILLFVFFLFLLIGVVSIEEYPEHSSLTYEECTFINYELVRTGGKASSSKRYYIYVEEYDTPLEIDNIVVGNINKEILDSLKEGNIIKVSIDKDEKLELYSISYKNIEILSYETYLLRHNSNNKVGVITCFIVTIISACFIIGEIVYYKKSGFVI